MINFLSTEIALSQTVGADYKRSINFCHTQFTILIKIVSHGNQSSKDKTRNSFAPTPRLEHRFSANGTMNAHDLGAIVDWLFQQLFCILEIKLEPRLSDLTDAKPVFESLNMSIL